MKGRWVGIAVAILELGALADAEQVSITGTVVGADGAPMEACKVMIAHWPDWNTMNAPVWAEATTDIAGRFRLSCEHRNRWSSRSIIAIKEGFPIAWDRAPESGEARIKLGGEAATCRGRVSDDEGRRLEGIGVWVSNILTCEGVPKRRGGVSLWGFASPLYATTDAQGRFEIPGLPPGADVGLCARGEGWAYYREPRSGNWREVSEEVTIRLAPEATISGRTTREGDPAAGVRVFAVGHDESADYRGETVTAEDGSYSITCLPAGTYCAAVDPPEGYTAAARQDLEVQSGEHLAGVDFALTEGAVVEGTVTLADTGEPAAGAFIKSLGPARPGMAAMREIVKCDENGRYSVRMAAGWNSVSYIGGVPGDAVQDAEGLDGPLELREGEVRRGVNFVLHLPRNLGGIVLDPDGQAAPGVNVWAQRQLNPSPFSPDPVQADERGHFVLPVAGNIGMGFASGSRDRFMIYAQDAERGLVGCALTESIRDDIAVHLEQGGYLGTEVRDLQGNPVPEVELTCRMVYTGGGPWWYPPFVGVSDDEGRLLLGPLPPGQELWVWLQPDLQRMVASGDWGSDRRYSLGPGETLEIARLQLNLEGRMVRGKVLDEKGQPLAGALVCTPAGRPRTRTDAEGAFKLTGLKARGSVTLLAVTTDARRACGVTLDPELERETVLALQRPGVVQGVAYDPEGHAKAGADVTLHVCNLDSYENEIRGLRLWAHMKTDEPGRWRFEPLVPGLAYRLYAEAARVRGSATEEFTAEPGPDPQVLDLYIQ